MTTEEVKEEEEVVDGVMSIKHEEGEVAMENEYEQTDKGKTNTRAHKTEEEKGGGAEPEVVRVMAIIIQTGAGGRK